MVRVRSAGEELAAGQLGELLLAKVDASYLKAHELLRKESPSESEEETRRFQPVERRKTSILRIECVEEEKTQDIIVEKSREVAEKKGTSETGSESETDVEEITFVRTVAKSLANMAMAGNSSRGARSTGPFRGRTVPRISVEDYAERLVSYLNVWQPTGRESDLGKRTLTLAMIYLDRIMGRHRSLRLNGLNIHRFLLVSCLLAVKSAEDVPFPNSFWARVGGLELEELNKLESDFLGLLDFRVFVSPEELESLRRRFEEICRY